jgi:hypothetical protein
MVSTLAAFYEIDVGVQRLKQLKIKYFNQRMGAEDVISWIHLFCFQTQLVPLR